MCRLIDSIDHVGEAADELARVCARHSAIMDAATAERPVLTALRRTYRAAHVIPSDMLAALGKIK